jgi:hypothetical protein
MVGRLFEAGELRCAQINWPLCLQSRVSGSSKAWNDTVFTHDIQAHASFFTSPLQHPASVSGMSVGTTPERQVSTFLGGKLCHCRCLSFFWVPHDHLFCLPGSFSALQDSTTMAAAYQQLMMGDPMSGMRSSGGWHVRDAEG